MIESSGNKLMEASGDDGKAILYEDRIELVKKGGFITSVESTELIIDLDDIKNIDFIKISRVFSATKHVHFRNKGLRKYSKGKNKMGVSDGLIQIENSDHRFKELKKAALKQKNLNELKDSIFENFEFEEEQRESIKEKIREAQNYIKEGEYDSAARVINKIQRIKRNKRKESVVKERLNDLREFIYKNNEIPKDGEKPYIEEFNKAQSYLEKNEPDSAEKAIKEAKNLKNKEIELKEELDDLKEYIYDVETQADQKPPYIEKFHEAKKKIKEGDYKTAKNKIRRAKKLKK